jgi:sulfotransferase
MTSRFHLISGLPRSGSTLLCALLRQNPRFEAAMTSPVASLCGALIQKMSGASEFSMFFSDERRGAILRAVFEGYYAHIAPGQVVFDTNRTWTSKTALLRTIYPEARIICCVREVSWIIDSIERIVRRNALQPSRIFNYKSSGTVYSRVETLMNPESGLVGLAWSSMREAWFSENAARLIVINYETLVREPHAVIGRLYRELGEAPFAHDFENVVYDEPAYDAELGIPGMHKVRPKVEFQKRETCLPPDLFAKYAETNFWLNPKMNMRNVTIL